MSLSKIELLRSLIAIALITMAKCCEDRVTASGLSSSELQRSYQDIDAYLIKNVKENDIESNIAAAHRMLEDKSVSKSESLSEAIKLFTSLETVKSNHKCDVESHNILSDNIRATGRDIASKELQRGRVDEVIYQSCVELAKHCLHVYPKRFQVIHDGLDGEASDLIETLDSWFLKKIYVAHFDQDFMTDPYKNYPIRHHTFLYRTATIESKQDADIAIRALRLYAVGDQRCLYPAECDAVELEERVGNLFKKYLVGACQSYVSLLGPELFSLADFDAQFYTKPGMTFSYDPEQSYYQSWARFRFCTALINQKQDQLLKQVFGILEDI